VKGREDDLRHERQARKLGFEVAALGAARGTRVGAGPTQLAPCANQAARLRVALFGAGTVGYGVYRHLAADPERFEIVGIAVDAAAVRMVG
jgi:hypothetical protein